MSEEKLNSEKQQAEESMRFEFIRPENIVENKLNDAVINNIDYLKDSIRANGLRQPLDVLPEDNSDTFRIIGGHRRFAAIKKGLEEGYGWFSKGIPCVIQRSQIENTLDEQIVMYEENINSRNYQDANYLEGVKTLYMLYKEKSEKDADFKGSAIIKRLAEKLNIGTRQAYKTAYIATYADPWITNAVEDRLLTIEYASIISHLDQAKQDALHMYFDEHQIIPKAVLDMYRKGAGKKAQETENTGEENTSEKEPEREAVPGIIEETQQGTQLPPQETESPREIPKEETSKPQDPHKDPSHKKEIKEMVSQFDDSNFFGTEDNTMPEEIPESYDGYEDPDYGASPEEMYNTSTEAEEKEKSSSGSKEISYMPQGYQMKQRDAALASLTWFSEMADKKNISEQEKAYVDTIVKMLAKFYFPIFVEKGYIDGNMRGTIKEIVDMMSGLV